jgi:hypothetical protein
MPRRENAKVDFPLLSDRPKQSHAISVNDLAGVPHSRWVSNFRRNSLRTALYKGYQFPGPHVRAVPNRPTYLLVGAGWTLNGSGNGFGGPFGPWSLM